MKMPDERTIEQVIWDVEYNIERFNLPQEGNLVRLVSEVKRLQEVVQFLRDSNTLQASRIEKLDVEYARATDYAAKATSEYATVCNERDQARARVLELEGALLLTADTLENAGAYVEDEEEASRFTVRLNAAREMLDS